MRQCWGGFRPGLAGPHRLGEERSLHLIGREKVLGMRRSWIPEARVLEVSGRPRGFGSLETSAGRAVDRTPRDPCMRGSAQGLILLHGISQSLPAPEPYSAA